MILGFMGEMNNGKSTAADLVRHIMPLTEIVNLADPLKRFCIQELGFTHEGCYGASHFRTEENELDLILREVLKSMGTEWGRNMLHKDIWAWRCEQTIKERIPLGVRHFVIPDMRHRNEIDWFRRAEQPQVFKVIRIKRHQTSLMAALGEMARGEHTSETEQRELPDSLFDGVMNVPDFRGNVPGLHGFMMGWLYRFLMEHAPKEVQETLHEPGKSWLEI